VGDSGMGVSGIGLAGVNCYFYFGKFNKPSV